MPADRVNALPPTRTDVPGYENFIKAASEDAPNARKQSLRAAVATENHNVASISAPSERDSIIQDYFAKLKELNDKYGEIPPEHIWNLDEKGVRMVRRHLNGPAGKKHNFLRTCKNRDCGSVDNMKLVTITECVSAAGAALSPSFLLPKGPYPHPDVLDEAPFGCIGQSGTGWTDDEIDELWFTQLFIPKSYDLRVCDDKPIILTLDSRDVNATGVKVTVHSNKGGVEFILLHLPPKCLHPLDVAAFTTIQADWKENCMRCTKKNITIDRYNIIPHYSYGARSCIKPELIKRAFRDTGIYPVNPDVHFAGGSSVSSGHVPATPEVPPQSNPDHLVSSEDLEDVKPVHGPTGSAGGMPPSLNALRNNPPSISGRDTVIPPPLGGRISPPCSGCLVHGVDPFAPITYPWSGDEKLSRAELLDELLDMRHQSLIAHVEKERYKAELRLSNAQYAWIQNELDVLTQLKNDRKKKRHG